MKRMEGSADKSAASPRRQREYVREDSLIEQDSLIGGSDDGDPAQGEEIEHEPSSAFLAGREFPEEKGAQAEFCEQFDEDLYTDREDRPAQGNTADVAMGEQRFGSEAEAYTEYAYRRPGDRHRGDESAVGQARDPADIENEDGHP